MTAEMISGIKFIVNNSLTIPENVPVIKPWWQKVIEWNPCNIDFIKPNFKVIYHPDPNIYMMEESGVAFAHSATIDRLKEVFT